jgi:hypothetical protein
MRLRLQFAAAVAVGTAFLVTAVTITTAQADTVRTGAPAPGNTVSDIISPSRSSPPPLNTSPLPPFPPSNLTATATDRSVTLNWTASRSGCCSVGGYVVRYSQGSGDPGWTQDVGNVTSATITAHIEPGTTYQFSVVAYDWIGGHVSAPSNVVTVTTPSTSTNPAPGPPTNLTARVTSTSVTLSWTAPTSTGCCGVDGYDVTYYRQFNDYGRVQHVGNVTTVTITVDIQPLAQYQLSVSAKDSLGHSSASVGTTVVTPARDTGDTTPPPAPSNLVATDAGMAVSLSWTPPADTSDVAGYNIYTFDGVFIANLVGSTSGTTFLAPAGCNIRSYFVRSRDAAGNISIAAGPVGVRQGPPSCGPSSSAPPPPPTCRVSYVSSEWPGGFAVNIDVTNTGRTPIDGWTLTYTLRGDQRITGSWGGTATQSGTAVTFHAASWDATIAPGTTVYVGVQGTWQASDAPPTAFAVNGAACSTS